MADAIKADVKEYYSKDVCCTSDLKTSACCSTSEKPSAQVAQAIAKVPEEIANKYYGCGLVIPSDLESSATPLSIVDLGCGAGRDVYVLANLVAKGSKITGVDFSEEQLSVAKAHVGSIPSDVSLTFIQSDIEDLSQIPDNSVDLIISNCVINLAPNKDKVLSEAYRVLNAGGELFFSDVYCDRRLSEAQRSHKVAVGECLGGALYINDFYRLLRSTGFQYAYQVEEPRVLDVDNEELKELLGDAKFWSITFRLFKLDSMETLREDYGEFATFKGPAEEFKFTDSIAFVKDKMTAVDGNTADVLRGCARLSGLFNVEGDKADHYGEFSDAVVEAGEADSGGSCCSSPCC